MLAERIISLVAPEACLVCSKKGFGFCIDCQQDYLELALSRCYRCHKVTRQHQLCPNCRRTTKLGHLWVVTMYQDIGKDILHNLKFERSGYLAKDIARIMAEVLPILPSSTVICHVPTAPSRIRVRGYDQAQLIAKRLNKLKKLEYQDLLRRSSYSRQLGSTRDQRLRQASKAFELNKPALVKGKNILIVDDVTTSGATLEAVSKLFKKAGAQSVDAIVFAQALD